MSPFNPPWFPRVLAKKSGHVSVAWITRTSNVMTPFRPFLPLFPASAFEVEAIKPGKDSLIKLFAKTVAYDVVLRANVKMVKI